MNAVPRAHALALLLLGLAACAALWTIGPGAPDKPWAPLLLRGYVIAWGCYLLAAIVVTRTRAFPKWALGWIVAVALALRVASLMHAPVMSTDSFRYLWDGRVINAGINPYRYAPDAPELRHLRDKNWRMSFKSIRTLYPPGAELLFAGLASLRARDRAAFAWAFTLFDFGTVLLLVGLLRRTGRAAERVIWYGWCPLAAIECSAGCHVDAVGLFFLVLALWLLARPTASRVGGALSYTAAIMAKGPAVITLPLFVARAGGRFLAVFLIACALLVAPFLGAGRELLSGLGYYFGFWETNASIFYLLHRLLDFALGVKEEVGFTPTIALHTVIIRAVTTLALIGFMVWLIRRRRPEPEWLIGAAFALLAAALLVGAPTLPWYVIWTVPLLCWWPVAGWVAFTLTVFVQYYARWVHSDWYPFPLLLGYVPVYALLAWEWGRGKRVAPALPEAHAGAVASP